MKVYIVQYNIGRVRYAVSFHNGQTTHKDGSPFFDLHLCRNRRDLARFVRSLVLQGYTER